jgi:hypothetical protein
VKLAHLDGFITKKFVTMHGHMSVKFQIYVFHVAPPYHIVTQTDCTVHEYEITRKFKSGGLHERHVVATWESWEPSQHSLADTGKPRKTCAEVASRRTFRILTSSQQFGN